MTLSAQLLSMACQDEDAAATVNDFLDFTEYLPADMSRSLKLVEELEALYQTAAASLDERTKQYWSIPTAQSHDRSLMTRLRAEIAEQLQKVSFTRAATYEEAQRLQKVLAKCQNRINMVLVRVDSQPLPPSRDPTPARQTAPPVVSLRLGTLSSHPLPSRRRGRGESSIATHNRQDDLGGATSDEEGGRAHSEPRAQLLRSQQQSGSNLEKMEPAQSAATVPDSQARDVQTQIQSTTVQRSDGIQRRLTAAELAALRKRMKKNSEWQPTEAMMDRELMLLGVSLVTSSSSPRTPSYNREQLVNSTVNASHQSDAVSGRVTTPANQAVHPDVEDAADSAGESTTEGNVGKVASHGSQVPAKKPLSRTAIRRGTIFDSTYKLPITNTSESNGSVDKDQNAIEEQSAQISSHEEFESERKLRSGKKPWMSQSQRRENRDLNRLGKNKSRCGPHQARYPIRAARGTALEEDGQILDGLSSPLSSLSPNSSGLEPTDIEGANAGPSEAPARASKRLSLPERRRNSSSQAAYGATEASQRSRTSADKKSAGPSLLGGRVRAEATVDPINILHSSRRHPNSTAGTHALTSGAKTDATTHPVTTADGPRRGQTSASSDKAVVKLQPSSKTTDRKIANPARKRGIKKSSKTLFNETDDVNAEVDPNEPVFCTCRSVSSGEMVACDNEECPYEWFHLNCLGLKSPPKVKKWYCEKCTAKQAAAAKATPERKRRRLR